jgi:hypothetical protein
VDWKQVYLLKLTPPLIPPRGEVNAADAFDIGNFDEDDTKGIKVRRNFQSIKIILYLISYRKLIKNCIKIFQLLFLNDGNKRSLVR